MSKRPTKAKIDVYDDEGLNLCYFADDLQKINRPGEKIMNSIKLFVFMSPQMGEVHNS
jgi:hypothetical protein